MTSQAGFERIHSNFPGLMHLCPEILTRLLEATMKCCRINYPAPAHAAVLLELFCVDRVRYVGPCSLTKGGCNTWRTKDRWVLYAVASVFKRRICIIMCLSCGASVPSLSHWPGSRPLQSDPASTLTWCSGPARCGF